MIYRQKPKKLKTIKTAPKSKTNMRNWLRGITFWTLWYLSIIVGFFFFVCPFIPLVLISPRRYRKWTDRVFGMWEPFPVAMMEVCFGIRVVLSGDKINPFESSLFVMNHRTRVDWSFLWLGMFHCCQPNAHNLKYILKIPIMHIPALGWVMQACGFIFLHRNWSKDQPLLNNILDYLNDSDNLYQVLLFPEGTDFTEKSMKKSHKYAEENNLQKYYKVLHPRTTGFAFVVSKMRSGGHLKAIYDLTIAYPKTMAETETDILRGKFPEEVHFNVRRHSSSNIPHDEEKLKSWLNDIWKEKEEKLQKFYSSGSFTEDGETDDVLYNLTEQNIDFGKMTIQNGVIRYDTEENSNSINKEGSKVGSIKVNETQMIEAVVVTPEDSSTVASPPHSSTAAAPETPTIIASPARSSIAPAAGPSSIAATESQTYARNNKSVNCQDVYRSENYKPSYVLNLVLTFWIAVIILWIHLMIYNFYVQIWVLVHSLMFTALSFVSNGFQHITASAYFYRYGRKPCIVKKSE